MASDIPLASNSSSRRTSSRQVTLRDLGSEPFRLLFPAGVLAGVVGVSLWPLHVWGFRAAYPGLEHARLMAFGLFGGFILGFLGTVLPRQTSTPPLRSTTVLALGAVHLSMVATYAMGLRLIGDSLAAALLGTFVILMITRFRVRKSEPPPAFVLVALAFACALSGALLSIALQLWQLDGSWAVLQRLLAYQGFVLLPILGVGTFILPGLLGQDATTIIAPDMLLSGGRGRAIRRSLLIGLIIVISFPVEAWGWTRTGHALRLAAILYFLWRELPLHRGARRPGAMGSLIRIAFVSVALGYGAIAVWPALRVGLLHLTLVGGFALVTFVVGARVSLAHGGRASALQGPMRWLWTSGMIMLFATATRLSADLLPQVRDSHYAYGALAWLVGVAIWAAVVLPLMRRTQ